jgi:hypothetical protein
MHDVGYVKGLRHSRRPYVEVFGMTPEEATGVTKKISEKLACISDDEDTILSQTIMMLEDLLEWHDYTSEQLLTMMIVLHLTRLTGKMEAVEQFGVLVVST